VTKQLALAHTYGNGKKVSCRNVADSVSKLLMDINVNHYASLTMDAVPVMTDLVSGVEVQVLDDFSGIDDTLIKGEKVTLIGEHALNYVRTRYGLEDSSNENRMKRQRQYLNALFEKTKAYAQNDENFIAEATYKMSDFLVSNRSATKLQEVFEKITSYKYEGIIEIEGELKKGEEFMEFYPDETSVKEIVIDLFYKEKE
ncbi:MAG: LCP family protein, partial [Clostridia bacterium]|nr:LCP family protein [Clostridia bacterium]